MTQQPFKQRPASPNRNPQMREFTVNDPMEGLDFPSEFQQEPSISEIEQAAKSARQSKLSNIDRVSEQAKKRIEILANIARLSKDIDIGGIKFSLRTLKAKEAHDATFATFSIAKTELDAGFEMRKQNLARSIFKIDGQDVELVLGDNSLETKVAFIGEMEDIVVNKLYAEFIALKQEAQQKYGLNSDKDVKEVIEDLKKP